MSSNDPKGGGKPFLGDDDLLSELDQWDQMFDALHADDPGGAPAPSEPVMAWPTPTPTPTPAPVAAPPPLEPAAEDDLESQLTLDRAVPTAAEAPAAPSEAPPRAPARELVSAFADGDPYVDPAETDFSDLGADGPPAALGDLLGRPTTTPLPSSAVAEDDLPIAPSPAPHAPSRRAAPTQPPPIDDDDDVFTSASRPPMAPSRPSTPLPLPPDLSIEREGSAPRRMPGAAPRRGPAIIRRTTTPVTPVAPPSESHVTPARGIDISQFAEQTRVAEYGAFPDSARSSSITSPPPFDDDEYEIEIDASAQPTTDMPSAPIVAELPGITTSRTRTAHVVRRADTPTRPPPAAPAAPRGEPGLSFELEVDTPLPPAAPAAEDDFSDVAAAVSAADDPLAGLGAVAPLAARDPDDEPAVEVVIDAEPALHPELAPVPQIEREPYEAAAPAPRARVDVAALPRVKTPTSVPPLGQPLAPVTPASVDAEDAIPVEIEPPEPEPEIDLETAVRAWPEQVPPLPASALDESAAAAMLVYERELATVDDSAASAALRVEAGRLCERLGDVEHARTHYDAALLADPRATAALRGLRRIARASGDLVEAVRQLDAEIEVAGALERRPLSHYRVDLLMASDEQDLARVAVGEILDTAPSDVRALLAQLELAFLDGRADEFGSALEQLAQAVTDPELRAAVQSARGALAAHHGDTTGAASWFSAAAEADPTSLGARLGAVRHAAAQADGPAAGRAFLELARGLEAADPLTAAAAAVRAQQWTAGATGAEAAALATVAAERDPLVARLAAETAATGSDPASAAAAFVHWARTTTQASERAYAAARAAELDPTRGVELWSSVLAIDPGDDYAAAQLRTAHVAADATQASIEVDLAVSADADRERARLRASYGLIAQGDLVAAIDVLRKAREARPGSLAIAEALGEALAAANEWTERAKLFAELAATPGEQLDREVAQLRSAIAWEDAVGAVAAAEGEGAAPSDELQRATAAALEAWDRVLEHAGHDAAPSAHAAAIVLASRIQDRDVLSEILGRAQAAERSPWAAASLGLRRARLYADDPGRAEALLRALDLEGGALDDPRTVVARMLLAARQNDLGEAAAALDDRAQLLERTAAAAPHASELATEIATLRLRAAQLALDAGDAARATELLGLVEQALPQLGVVPDLLAAARRRAGDRVLPASGRRAQPAPGTTSADLFSRFVRDAELATAHGELATAITLYQRALELRPNDPVATVPLVRIAAQLRETPPITTLALAQLRAAEEAGDGAAKAAAYELLAHIDGELRGDLESAQIALESAVQADPTRGDLRHRLERRYAAAGQVTELLRLRKADLDAVPAEHVADRSALLVDIASLAERDHRPEIEIADIYRSVLELDPRSRLALMHLEAIVRRSGFSAELADLEEKIATYFEGDPRTQAAFWTRAGETLAELGQIDEAVQRFGKAETAVPGHVPALEGWRMAALKGQLWIDVAEAARRQAASATDDARRAALYHFAGVALMDKALEGEQAQAAFRQTLEADPRHHDAFLRMRILLEEDANHDDLAVLLAQRLEVEDEGPARIELHRALAELYRNFLSDRDSAKEHYRFILASDPNDLRSHAAIADIAWEQGNWQEAADALVARARLERQPDVLKTLCFRLGLIYADRLVDVPMALKAFQRALTYAPDDEATLVRLAELATTAGEWKLALGATERLVKHESDPERRAVHLHRAAKIFRDGFGDTKRAERALNLALDGAPTSDEALSQLVQFYKDAGDMTSVRVHLNRVAGTMRTRAGHAPQDGVAYRVIARAMSARAQAGVHGSLAIARAAAELADLLGASGEPEQQLLRVPPTPDLSPLLRPEADEVLFPRGVQLELRQVFQLLGDRIAKHVGVDLRPYGIARGDRLRAKDDPTAAVAQSVATGLGFGEIDVYVSSRQPWVMVAEPTSPVSLVIGSAIAGAGGDAIRFAAGAALKLAQASLAIPARLPEDDLGILVVALLRLFQPELPGHGVDADAVAAQHQKLRRLIPSGLLSELRPFALAIDAQRFDHRVLARDLRVAGLRAGLVAAGSLLAGLRILAPQAGAELPGFLGDPLAQGLISFALAEDHAILSR